MKTAALLLFSLLLINGSSPAQNIDYSKSIKIDTTQIIADTTEQQIAERFYQTYYRMSIGEEKIFIDSELRKLDSEKKDKLTIAKGLSSTAVFFTGTGQSQNVPLVFCSRAAQLFPRDTQIVSNFGAVLRMLDSIPTSLKILLYANSICPNAPLILTNLGNSLFELFDDKSAEYFFKRALTLNPDYSLARQGLVNVYLKRKDLGSAMIELLKGAKGMYSQSMNDVQSKAKNMKGYDPPQEPMGDKPDDQNSSSGHNATGSDGHSASDDQLQLPDFPNWVDEIALIDDHSISVLEKQLAQISYEASAGMMAEAEALQKMSDQEKMVWYTNTKKPGKILGNKFEFGMNMLGEYYEAEIKKANKEYLDNCNAMNKKFTKDVEQLGSWTESKMREIDANGKTTPEGGIEALTDYGELLAVRCKKTMNLIKENFSSWEKIAAKRHFQFNDLLTTYWVYCEEYLNQTYDKNEFTKLEGKRRFFVTSHYSILTADYSVRQIGFAGMNMSALATINGKCPEAPPRPAPTSKEQKVKAPKKTGPPCPFEKGKLKVGLGVCSIGLDCESIEGECGEGFIAAAKWNYKKKEMTIFGGAGVKANLGILPGGEHNPAGDALNAGLGATAEAKGGLSFTFNKDGQLIDAGVTGEVSGKANLGGFSQGMNMGVSATAGTGINVEFTKEYTGTVFR